MEITSEASAKLAECEKTIMKLGKQLKALGSAKVLSVVDISDNTKQKLKQRSSLRDQMICEDSGEVSNEESPKTKQIISMTLENAPSACNYNAVSFPDSQIATPATWIKSESTNVKSGALVIVPSKRRGGGGGIGFLRKLLVRRKKGSSKNTSIYFGK